MLAGLASASLAALRDGLAYSQRTARAIADAAHDPARSIYIYYRHRTEQPLRVRTFIDFMIARLAENKSFFLEPSDLRTTRST